MLSMPDYEFRKFIGGALIGLALSLLLFGEKDATYIGLNAILIALGMAIIAYRMRNGLTANLKQKVIGGMVFGAGFHAIALGDYWILVGFLVLLTGLIIATRKMKSTKKKEVEEAAQ